MNVYRYPTIRDRSAESVLEILDVVAYRFERELCGRNNALQQRAISKTADRPFRDEVVPAIINLVIPVLAGGINFLRIVSVIVAAAG